MLRAKYQRRIAGDMRGKITSGNRNKPAGDRPESRPFFNVAEFPEIVAVYGKEPTAIAIMFPSNNMLDFYSEGYEDWGSKGASSICKRRCDGAECVDCITGEVTVCECPEIGCDAGLKFVLRLNAFILDPRTGMIINPICTRFESHSEHSANALRSKLDLGRAVSGHRFVGIPFNLSCKWVEQPTAKFTKKYPLWDLQTIGTVQQINQLADKGVIPTNEMHALTIGETMHMPELPEAVTGKAIEAPKEAAGASEPAQDRRSTQSTPVDTSEGVDENTADSTEDNGFAEQARLDLYNRLVSALSGVVEPDDKALKMVLIADKTIEHKIVLAKNFLYWSCNGNLEQVAELVPIVSKGRAKKDRIETLEELTALQKRAFAHTAIDEDEKMIDRVYKNSKKGLMKWLDAGEGVADDEFEQTQEGK